MKLRTAHPGGQPVKFEQDEWRVKFVGLPQTPSDPVATVIAVEMEAEPTQDQRAIRVNRKRESV
jgi:hypothetical protein